MRPGRELRAKSRHAATHFSRRASWTCRTEETKKAGDKPGFFNAGGCFLDRLDVARLLLAFVTLRDFERNLLPFFQRFEAGHVDRGEMREQIFAAAVRCNE